MSIQRFTVIDCAMAAHCHPETVRRAIRDWQDGKQGLRAHRRGTKGPYLIESADLHHWLGT